MKKNATFFTLLCLFSLALLPGCLGKKEVKKETVKKEKKVTRKSHSKELIEE